MSNLFDSGLDIWIVVLEWGKKHRVELYWAMDAQHAMEQAIDTNPNGPFAPVYAATLSSLGEKAHATT